ncbi:transporter substrate-binding domain-containing protein [Rhizobium sp. CSW-27]|nr:transporter substrate-binding domain-containing protein [Rhizobium sp. CSW-27]
MSAHCALATNLVFTTESYPPYSYRSLHGEVLGMSVEQVREIIRSSGADIRYTIEVLPWARALALAETQSDHCVFLTARTPEREARFHWVTPLAVTRNFLVRRKDSPIRGKTLEDVRNYIIGTQRDDYTELLLRQKGFRHLDLSASYDFTLGKLLSGRIDLMPMSEAVISGLRDEGKPVEPVVLLAEQTLGIACNKAVPAPLVARLQAALDRMIANGAMQAIARSYGVTQSP